MEHTYYTPWKYRLGSLHRKRDLLWSFSQITFLRHNENLSFLPDWLVRYPSVGLVEPLEWCSRETEKTTMVTYHFEVEGGTRYQKRVVSLRVLLCRLRRTQCSVETLVAEIVHLPPSVLKVSFHPYGLLFRLFRTYLVLMFTSNLIPFVSKFTMEKISNKHIEIK